MEKVSINAFEHANEILGRIRKGILVTAKLGEQVNSMTIGWGTIGVHWSRPVFVIYIRKNRFTTHMVHDSKEFTINVPLDESMDKEIAYLGAHSGRDEDKVKKCNLTLVPGNKVNAPGIKEIPLTLECKVLFSELQDITTLPGYLKDRYYPQDVDSLFCGPNKDEHYAIYGEIVDSYIIK